MQTLDYGRVEQGLRELNPDVHCDMGPKTGSLDWTKPDGTKERGWHPFAETRAGVFYKGKHICSVDRGVIPEQTQWKMKRGYVEIPMQDVEKYDEARILYFEVVKSDPGYDHAYALAEAKQDNFQFGESGKVFKLQALVEGDVIDHATRVGWRHTFEKLIAARIPGITRRSLEAKFGVDLLSALAG